ncbi:MAG TPA: AAA family ATPase [Candidatus Saccharimonadales bacterium]|nr:AAA family ATPase [Candidatus Saccharimonadales bacterium]
MSHGVKIIGVAGANGSGKDTVGELLAKHHNYLFVSVTDLLRQELIARSKTTERANMRELSAEWRRQFGLGVLVDRALAQYEQVKDQYAGVIMASLRNPYEADRVHELDGTVVWVDADPKIRFDRVRAGRRGRVDDNKTFEQFVHEEEAEMHASGDAATLDMSAVKARADVTIINNSSDIQTLQAQVEQVLGL